MARNLKPVWLANHTSEACRNADQTNYTACGVIIDKDFPYDIIDHKRVKYIPFGDFSERKAEGEADLEPTNLVINFVKEIGTEEDTEEATSEDETEAEEDLLEIAPELPEDRHVFVADTKNHCLRKIVLKLKNVETVAGVCG